MGSCLSLRGKRALCFLIRSCKCVSFGFGIKFLGLVAMPHVLFGPCLNQNTGGDIMEYLITGNALLFVFRNCAHWKRCPFGFQYALNPIGSLPIPDDTLIGAGNCCHIITSPEGNPDRAVATWLTDGCHTLAGRGWLRASAEFARTIVKSSTDKIGNLVEFILFATLLCYFSWAVRTG